MTTTVSLSELAAAMRASNSLLLDLLTETPVGEDLLDRLIVSAVGQSNTATLSADPEFLRSYGTLDALLPDEARKPVTISAVANMICIPFETVRRRIQQLAANGICVIGPNGVVVPTQVLAREEYKSAMLRTWELAQVLYNRLRDNLCLTELYADKVPPYEGAPLIRAVAHVAYGHLLRMTSAFVRTSGDLTMAMILLAVQRENSEHTATLPSAAIGPGIMPDELRVPVNAATIAEILGLGESTVSRRLTRLVRDGRCLKRKGGVIVASAYVARPEIMALLELNHGSLLRMFEPLRQLGILSAWDHTHLQQPVSATAIA
ncbi:hypothetical protein SAMN02745126_05942 [Enhydrobacter aerosaccus]|uniref:HTH crp-type domain-containing protein n=1 Tax=Enhydrobacter aerosaccus TaxID=225324 RepID=A0A1T4TBC4_9HYPH|nr:hypothetical protein [Enhydrobacter aerosaccus]SKA37697.1 hypothetical protein SAMN02745126_05942 [Enhydrobacter aerosaccus]